VDSLTVRNVNESVTLRDGFYVASVKGIEFRWDYILTYIALWFLQGGGLGSMGFLNNVRSFLWIYIQQYTTRFVTNWNTSLYVRNQLVTGFPQVLNYVEILSGRFLYNLVRFSDNDSRPFRFPVPTKILSYVTITITICHYCLDTCGHCSN